MAFARSDGSGPFRAQPIEHFDGLQEGRRARVSRLGSGSLACPSCDAPVLPARGPSAPSTALACPYCGHSARVRDFLSLSGPARPARVDVRVVRR